MSTSLPMQVREAPFEPATFDEAQRLVTVVWTTGARIRRLDAWSGQPYDEELVVSPEAVDMTRFEAGAVQVLDSHRRWGGVEAVLGLCTRGWLQGGQGLAEIRLSGRPELAGLVGDIAAGVVRAVSFGYSVERYEVTRASERADGGLVDLWRAVRWTPQEVSFVAVPADPNAGTRSAVLRFPCEFSYQQPKVRSDQAMPTPSTIPTATIDEAEARRQADIAAVCKLHGESHLTSELIRSGATLQAAQLAVLNARADRDRASGGHVNVLPVSFGREHGQPREQMIEVLAARMGGPPLRGHNEYAHSRVADMARELLELEGVRTGGMSSSQLIERGLHSTSDFSGLLTAAGERTLRQAYGSYQGGVRRIAKPSTARDFRAKSRLMLGEAPELLQVNEHGEFKRGSMAESKESYALGTYGRIFSITRQALVNDDLDAFGDAAIRFGRAAFEFESKFLVALLTSNPVMSDGVPLFNASHNNLGTGAGSALSSTSLSSARTAMRLQKGLDGKTPIDATPQFLVVPAALETTGEQLLAVIQPQQISNVNPFAGKLDLVVDPRLDAASATAWYLAADPRLVDTVEYAYLEGDPGPQVQLREGFEVDGLELKVRLDFGGGVLDWRGLYKANGA